MCKTNPEKVAPPEIVTDRRFRPNLGCSRGDNDPNFFHTPRRVPSYVARHTAKNGRQCHSFLTPFPLFVTGELDKNGHNLIREGVKPDFLVHVPGDMAQNLLIVEVKAVTGAADQMADDLKKLTRFRRPPANYFGSLFWVYGRPQKGWPALRAQILAKAGDGAEFDRRLVRCFLHEEPGQTAIQVPWD